MTLVDLAECWRQNCELQGNLSYIVPFKESSIDVSIMQPLLQLNVTHCAVSRACLTIAVLIMCPTSTVDCEDIWHSQAVSFTLCICVIRKLYICRGIIVQCSNFSDNNNTSYLQRHLLANRQRSELYITRCDPELVPLQFRIPIIKKNPNTTLERSLHAKNQDHVECSENTSTRW